MSDNDQEIDIEDYEDADSDSDSDSKQKHSNNTQYSDAKRRAHHNALERKRRDHIKDNFFVLKNSIPTLQGRKVTSRTQVLKKAVEYIQLMQRRKSAHKQDIDDLIRQNNLLQAQIDICERSRQH